MISKVSVKKTSYAPTAQVQSTGLSNAVVEKYRQTVKGKHNTSLYKKGSNNSMFLTTNSNSGTYSVSYKSRGYKMRSINRHCVGKLICLIQFN